LTILLALLVKPTDTAGVTGHAGVKFSDRCAFALPQIEGSTLAWDSENIGGTSKTSGDHLIAKATYTTLPELNSAFGLKQAGFTCDEATDVLPNGAFEVFYRKNATNHPGGQANSPNWFYYWNQFVPVGRIATLTYNNNLGPDAYGATVVMNRTTEVTKKASEQNGETQSLGLHTFYETLVHESYHITLWEGWWGIGGMPTPAADTDGDNYPDSFEISADGVEFGFDKDDIDDLFSPQTNSAGYRYEESKCNAQEHLIEDLDAYDDQDWSFDNFAKGINQ